MADPDGPSGDAAPDWASMVLVGRIGRPHGVRGAVVVAPETDFVEARFAPGASLWTLADGRPERLTVEHAHWAGRRLVVAFAGATGVPDAERLGGRELRIPESALQPLAPGMFYLHDLVGCQVTAGGEDIGRVVRVDGGAGASLLVVEGPRGEVLVPFAAAMCPTVDVANRRIEVAPPEGLLDVNVTGPRRPRRWRKARAAATGPGGGTAT